MSNSPREFLKARRPHQFSDTTIVEEASIGRLELEYYLSTLTNRSQEAEFESFAKRMCELEICPNLVPMTGPTGGGDGKVDSETYPVSDKTALEWYVGIGRKASQERWAFAFSAKQDWRSKVQADVKKISETKRGYKKAIFVSSRPIPNDKKAEVQDALKTKYKIDVRILDSNWLLDNVFDKNRQDVAIEKLNIQTAKQTRAKKGSRDTQHEEDLMLIDKRIETAISDDEVNSAVVDDAIESAILSRKLEKPRTEIDGRFDSAIRLAEEYGNEFSKFEAAYQFAWTTFWWHEDFAAFLNLYKNAEKQVIDTNNVYNFERLTNLWNLLVVVRRKSKKIVSKSFFDTHTALLKTRLVELSKDSDKPSGALYAKTLLLEIELNESYFAGKEIDRILNDLKQVVIDSKGLVGFPLKPLVDILTEIGGALEDSPSYDDLFETIVQVTTERDGELAAGELILERARKLMTIGQPYTAIRTLGNALWKLHKYESREAAVVALYIMGNAYRDVGLYWAARGSLLSAASLAVNDFWNHNDINGRQLLCYDGLRWGELKLGRLPELLEWHQLDTYTRNIMASKVSTPEKLIEQSMMFDLALGAMFLRADLVELKQYERLPDALIELGLEHASIALLYALGHQDKLPKEFTDTIGADEAEEYFTNWAKQHSEHIHPKDFADSEGQTLELRSTILGCEVVVSTDREERCLETAESVLAALESFLATSNLKHAMSKESRLDIHVAASDDGAELISYEVDDDASRPTISVYCKPFDPYKVNHARQGELSDSILNIIAEVSARIVMFRDFENDMTELMRDEGAVGRAVNFTCSYIRIGNVLGYQPKRKLEDWVNDKQHTYRLDRTKPFADFPQEENDKTKNADPEKSHSDPMLEAKHTDMKNVSIIRDNLWNAAKWRGIGYMVAPNQPPLLCVLFENIEYGKKIFEAWREDFGQVDEDETIRLTILRGIDKARVHDYRVGVTANITRDSSPTQFVVTSTRMHTMNPDSSVNLENFIKAHGIFRRFGIAPGAMNANGMPDIEYGHVILKREINIRDATDVGENDPDTVLLEVPEDNK